MTDEPKIIKFKKTVKTESNKEQPPAHFIVTAEEDAVLMNVNNAVSVRFNPKEAVVLGLMLISAAKYVITEKE